MCILVSLDLPSMYDIVTDHYHSLFLVIGESKEPILHKQKQVTTQHEHCKIEKKSKSTTRYNNKIA